MKENNYDPKTINALINKAEQEILKIIKGAFNNKESLDDYDMGELQKYKNIIDFLENEQFKIYEEGYDDQ